jgi:hypothetical protein
MSQHHRPTGLKEAPNQEPSQYQEYNVQDSGVIEPNRCLDHFCLMQWNESETSKNEFDHECSDGHRAVKGRQDEKGHLHAVVSPVYIQDWQHDEVSQDESDNTAEADTSIP